MQIEQRRLADLKDASHNSRTHSAKQVEQIADSMAEFGWTTPILIDEHGEIIAGHGRKMAALRRGQEHGPCVVLSGLTSEQKRAYLIADNQLPLNAGWDLDVLRSEIEALESVDFDTGVLGFDAKFLDALLSDALPPDDTPEPPSEDADPVTVEGDVWVLGGHRVMCGDSTSVDAVYALMAGERAALLHADPPYGMGKQADGVQNDNLRREKLDAFQMEWWATFRTFLAANASAYVWGNAPDLWRLWYAGGLAQSEPLALRNEIVWDKKHTPGMKSGLLTQFAEASERCLFFQVGDQLLDNVNTDQYWAGWEPIRGYLCAEAEAAGLTAARVREITGTQMYAHWFTKSQWSLVSQKHYAALADACPGHFGKPYSDLRAEYDRLGQDHRDHVASKRAYFDNTHEVMRDVWEFPRVTGDDRHGHATPKPVEMMDRVMRSSLPRGGLCIEPFGGSGSTLMGAERTGRRCYTMELTPAYVDVIVRRWQRHTGKQATHADTGVPFDDAGT